MNFNSLQRFHHPECPPRLECGGLPAIDTWELFDLQEDPQEIRNVYADPAYTSIREKLEAQLQALADSVGACTHPVT